MKQDMDEEKRKIAAAFLLILPAVALGVLGMAMGDVSASLWGQQAVAWAVFALLAKPLRRIAGRIPAAVWSVLLLVPLAAALWGQEVGGARRWVNLIVFHVHTAGLVLPALLVVLCRVKYPWPAMMAAAAMLSIQPDLMQMTAFCAAVFPVLWEKREKRTWMLGSVIVLSLLLVCCIRTPVSIEPVLYCEGILAMLGQTSRLLQAAGVTALAVIPLCWAYGFYRWRKVQMLSLAVYYAAAMLFALSGEYPVPFMGFGLSPVAGYGLAYACGAAQKQAAD